MRWKRPATPSSQSRTGCRRWRLAPPSDPEAAILDIGLPGMDGYQLARALRARFPSLLLIALTGYGQDSDASAAGDAGFDAHRTKPITIGQLLAEINDALDATGAHVTVSSGGPCHRRHRACRVQPTCPRAFRTCIHQTAVGPRFGLKRERSTSVRRRP